MPANSWLKKSLNKIILVFGYLTFILLFFLSLVFFQNYFRVKKIEIISQDKKPLITGVDNWKNMNLFLIKEEEINKQLVAKNSFLKSVQIIKKYPSTLILVPQYYQPIAQVKINSGFFYLGEDGRILAKSKDEKKIDYPVINYYQKLNYYSYSTGDWLELADIRLALQVIKLVTDLQLDLVSIDINGDDMILCNLSEKKIFFTTKKDIKQQEYQLTKIIKQFKVKGEQFKAVDLRFEKPVIKF
ncbi:hypothetical protein COY88_00430 [Candidatus Roizmanbacteria bacterium CG_4_10_14_0_8_um_filter_35_28]|uniref:POTRA domain-containing protein n=4 Tax=Candidatus Roizmaniibacteriota TaxID=1752723 RepID=A0A2M8F3T1_9BACT|nr:MAG: hypothetical protein COX47_02385 [Candidatus Roizmanbacteria bacterium CG23_combo_of_CG06-09_8_20_14_all_35_49]PIY71450.1 MAG: hypothetical protein COY88_00430 [Candidatus Roizmanbacteria bacterium CG_4_10_14_0_8_um_filter_35_28]PJC33964.1 MAG: hypothetical protein CO048_01815 [Candidatus Roizmanbacteria bacterium CG_4_9_14_0_2_um_filter_35_15]PJC82892.1 MAG: hypothetical protein CO006_01145 [Candidatus Roizmanbacteria bacterium CG_4_8_14_3_um_filter_35_14]